MVCITNFFDFKTNFKFIVMVITEVNDISFDEKKSLQIMKAAIATSKKALMDVASIVITSCWGVGF